MKKMIFALLVLGLTVASCGGSGNSKGHANDMCDCMKEAGLDDLDIDNAEKKAEKVDEKKIKKLGKCLASVLKEVESDMKDMKDKKAKSEYTREMLKAFIDSECADTFFEGLPYSDVESNLPDIIKALDKGELPGMGFGSNESFSESTGGVNDCGEYTITVYNDGNGIKEDCYGPGCDCR